MLPTVSAAIAGAVIRGFSLIFFAARIFVRLRMTRKPWWDDAWLSGGVVR